VRERSGSIRAKRGGQAVRTGGAGYEWSLLLNLGLLNTPPPTFIPAVSTGCE